MRISRGEFYKPEEIFEQVKREISEINEAEEIMRLRQQVLQSFRHQKKDITLLLVQQRQLTVIRAVCLEVLI
jgi:predicted XRE-type DNA-binding protein